MIGGLLVLLWVYAAFSKLLVYTTFTSQLKQSPLLKPYAEILVWLVPTVEIVIAILLTVMVTRIKGLYASLVLLSVFTIYIAGMLLSGVHLPCSCGGIINALSWQQHLVFNLLFMALSIAGIVVWKKQTRLISTKNISRE